MHHGIEYAIPEQYDSFLSVHCLMDRTEVF